MIGCGSLVAHRERRRLGAKQGQQKATRNTDLPGVGCGLRAALPAALCVAARRCCRFVSLRHLDPTAAYQMPTALGAQRLLLELFEEQSDLIRSAYARARDSVRSNVANVALRPGRHQGFELVTNAKLRTVAAHDEDGTVIGASLLVVLGSRGQRGAREDKSGQAIVALFAMDMDVCIP